MALPYFYINDIVADTLTLDEDTSKHVVQVLRKKVGDDILLTDGKGTKAIATITDDNRKRCAVHLGSREREEEPQPRVCIAISLIKNASRFEWFLEKATEIGVREIIPLLCERTEKEKFRHDRLNNILISAMLQSQQCWLPVLQNPADFGAVLKWGGYDHQFIGHCLPEERRSLTQLSKDLQGSSIVYIGPEGDFTKEEIEAALQHNVTAVMLGDTRLRTETAGIVAAILLRCR
ncbi:MAG TPA: RsmE family RNA methyltransferase [Chitinophagaceae bacterium]